MYFDAPAVTTFCLQPTRVENLGWLPTWRKANRRQGEEAASIFEFSYYSGGPISRGKGRYGGRGRSMYARVRDVPYIVKTAIMHSSA